MKKNYPPPEYKVGDLITGIDRSFPRSIYRYLGIADKTKTKIKGGMKGVTYIQMELIIFMNRFGDGEITYLPLQHAKEYRIATREELVESGAIPKSIDFITH